MPLISVIIPVYKVENYLHKCVNSVLDQSFKEIEVILVDDGSPDNCPKICDEFAQQDNRIVVIHKENGGSSDARNFGINEAKGEYILFLDSDDFWQGKDCLSNLVNTIQLNNADVTLYGTKDVSLVDHSEIITRGYYDITTIQKGKDAAIKSLFETGQFPGSAWVLAVKKSLLLENEIYFITGIKAEDIDWLTHLFMKAKTFDAVNDSFYMYIKNRPGSITNTADIKSAKDVLYSVTKWRHYLEQNISVSNRYLLSYLAYQYLTTYIILAGLRDSDRLELMQLIQSEKSILNYLYGKKGWIANSAVKILGIYGSAYLFNFIHKMNNKLPNFKKRLQ